MLGARAPRVVEHRDRLSAKKRARTHFLFRWKGVLVFFARIRGHSPLLVAERIARAYRWRTLQSSWMHDSWTQLDGDLVDKDVQNIFKVLTKTSKVLANRQLPACAENCTAIKDEVGAFKSVVPLVRALRNPGMCDRHWDRLSEEVGKEIQPDEAFTLAKALDMDLLEEDSLRAVMKVSDVAGKEHSIEQALDKMQNDLGDVELGVLPYRETGTYIIKVRCRGAHYRWSIDCSSLTNERFMC